MLGSPSRLRYVSLCICSLPLIMYSLCSRTSELPITERGPGITSGILRKCSVVWETRPGMMVAGHEEFKENGQSSSREISGS